MLNTYYEKLNHPDAAFTARVKARTRSEHDQLSAIMPEILEALKAGRSRTICDHGGGWSWEPTVLDLPGHRRIGVESNGVCFYQGQHDRATYVFSEEEKAYIRG